MRALVALYAFEVLLEQTEIDANEIVIVDLRCVSATRGSNRQVNLSLRRAVDGRAGTRGVE